MKTEIKHHIDDENNDGGFFVVSDDRGCTIKVFSWDKPNKFTRFATKPPVSKKEAEAAAIEFAKGLANE